MLWTRALGGGYTDTNAVTLTVALECLRVKTSDTQAGPTATTTSNLLQRRCGPLTSVAAAAAGPAPLLLLRVTAARLLRLLGGVERAASAPRDWVSLGALGATRKQAGAAIAFVDAI